MAYPSARNCDRMRSESTSALGQPSETNPTLGPIVGPNVGFERVKCGATLQDFSPSSFFGGTGWPGKPGKGKPAKIFLVWLCN